MGIWHIFNSFSYLRAFIFTQHIFYNGIFQSSIFQMQVTTSLHLFNHATCVDAWASNIFEGIIIGTLDTDRQNYHNEPEYFLRFGCQNLN